MKIKRKLTTYKELYQIAKMEHKIQLFKTIALILRNEIVMIDSNKRYGNAQETIEYLLRKSTIPTTQKGIVGWLNAWQSYFITCSTTAKTRLENAKKGNRPRLW